MPVHPVAALFPMLDEPDLVGLADSIRANGPILDGRNRVKPPIVAELIETWFPNVPRIELFYRSPRPGWVAWGNQSAGGAK